MFSPLPGEAESQAGEPPEGSFLPAWFARRDIMVAAIAGLFAAQALIRFGSHLSGDVAWYLYAAGRLLDGAQLYVDLIEVSSPLGLWLAVPVVALARWLAVDPVTILYAVLLFLTFGSVALSAKLLTLAGDVAAEARNLLPVLIAALLLFLPGADFGQREHVAIICVTPWLLLQWLRLDGRAVPFWLALVTGLLAAPGFLLKPHFVIAFLAVVIVVAAAGRNWRNAARVESLAVVLFLLAYFFAAQIYLPQRVFMSTIGTLGFIPFYGEPFRDLAGRLVLPGLLILATAFSALRASARIGLLQTIFFVAGMGFLVGASVQIALAYHFLPALVCLSLAAALGVVAVPRKAGAYGVASVAFASLVLASVFGESLARQTGSPRDASIAEAIEREAPGARAIFIASNAVEDAFPLVVEKEFVWASRFPRQWLIRFSNAAVALDGNYENYIVSFFLTATVDDLVALSPDIVFVERQDKAASADAFDHIGFWESDRRFADFWLGYEERPPIERFSVFVRK